MDNEWATPWDLFGYLNTLFGPFDYDVAATDENHKVATYFTKEDDALQLPWRGRVFCNPPYGRDIPAWVEKAVEETKSGRCERVVMLLPAKTDTKWWHDYVMRYADIVYFIKGRIKFEKEGKDNVATFPSVVVMFQRGWTMSPRFATLERP